MRYAITRVCLRCRWHEVTRVEAHRAPKLAKLKLPTWECANGCSGTCEVAIEREINRITLGFAPTADKLAVEFSKPRYPARR